MLLKLLTCYRRGDWNRLFCFLSYRIIYVQFTSRWRVRFSLKSICNKIIKGGKYEALRELEVDVDT